MLPSTRVTGLSNAIRGYAGEFGLTAAKGKAHLAFLLERIQADESLPALARELFAAQGQEYGQLQAQIVRPRARSGSAGSREPATKHCAARRKAVALAYRTPQTQVAEVGRRGTGQQDGAHRLETDGYGGKLHRKSCARRVGRRSLERSARHGEQLNCNRAELIPELARS